MKLIIDINDNEYMGIKKYPDNITSYPVTIHIYDAIRNGTPLEEELEKIKEKFEKEIEIKKKQNYSLDFFTGISDCIIITENRIDELKGENK